MFSHERRRRYLRGPGLVPNVLSQRVEEREDSDRWLPDQLAREFMRALRSRLLFDRRLPV